MRVLVVIPTYQEAENVERLLRELRATVPEADLLVVDDASPDGTAELARRAGVELGCIEVLSRAGKAGLGSAYRAGFEAGLDQDYDVMVSMDADFSHDPASLPALLAAVADGADLVIGSRYVPGGSIPDWPLYRRALSRYGNRYASVVLGLPIKDMTSGYRAYRAHVLTNLYDQDIRTNGYGALIEMAYRVARSGAVVAELPISFVDRRRGNSKMSGSIALETLLQVTRLGLTDRRGRQGPALRRVAAGSPGRTPPPPARST